MNSVNPFNILVDGFLRQFGFAKLDITTVILGMIGLSILLMGIDYLKDVAEDVLAHRQEEKEFFRLYEDYKQLGGEGDVKYDEGQMKREEYELAKGRYLEGRLKLRK